MNVVPLPIARVPMMLQSSLMLGALQTGQIGLLKTQSQISTGQRLTRSADDPAATVGIMRLKRQLDDNAQYKSNLQFAQGFLSAADNATGGLTDLITQGQSIASSQIGVATTPAERQAQATVVDSLISRALAIGNTRYQNMSIFGGQNLTQDAFSFVNGGYKYNGSTIGQGILTPDGSTLEYTVNGNQVFGGLSSQVVGYKDLTPALTSGTQLADVSGARLKGVTVAPISIADGATTLTVDLSRATTIGDVVTQINAALSSAGLTSSVSLAGKSIVLNAGATSNLSISDIGSGTAAADLGIAASAAAGTAVAGAALKSRITDLTPIAALAGGAGIDPAGLQIVNGTTSATISLAGLNTVQDLLNAINGSGTNVRAEIKADGTGLNLFNPLSGSPLGVGENGGQTADQLGLRSLNTATNIADFNLGAGVTPIGKTVGGPTGSLIVTRTDGTTFSVKVDNVKTPAQLAAAINAASGGTVTAAVGTSSNSLTLTDTTGGSGNVSVTNGSDYVSNGTDLGLFRTGTGATLAGTPITFSTDDFRVTRRDGTSFTVNMLGAVTVQDVLTRINTADGNTGANAVGATLNATGNGIALTDASVGAGALSITALNASAVPAQLGIAGSSASGVITGSDVNPLEPRGLLSSLTLLRDGLATNDNGKIQRAAELLQEDSARVIQVRGTIGARAKDVSARMDDLETEQLQLKSALSDLQDTDMTEAITKFQQLQTSYQASLKVAQGAQSLSLLDFLK